MTSLDRENLHRKIKKDEYRRELEYNMSLNKERLKNEDQADKLQKEIEVNSVSKCLMLECAVCKVSLSSFIYL